MAWQIDNDTSVGAAPAVPPAGSLNFFTNGNPGGGIEGTDVDDWWLNMVQAEIVAPVTYFGGTLSKTNNAQLRDAILISNKRGNYWADTGIANAYIITPVPAVTAVAPGDFFRCIFAHASTGAATIQIGSVTLPLVDSDGTALPAAAIAAGAPGAVFIDSAGTSARLVHGRSGANKTFTGATTMAQAVIGTPVNLIANQALLTVENASGFAAQFEYSGTATSTAVEFRLESVNPAFQKFLLASSVIGSIAPNGAGNATVFSTTSDEEFKEFIGPYDPAKAATIIRRDPVRDFHWTPDRGGGYAVGWGAQTSHAVSEDLAQPGGWYMPPEVSEALPAVYGINDDGHIVELSAAQPSVELVPGRAAVPNEPGAVYHPWGVDQSKRTPYLWAVAGWTLDRLDALEAAVAALTNKGDEAPA